ncbi:flagellar basal body-associated FliL family protein [Paracoccus sp. (in: a-proteobacteria)]|uniref:flagellar basal body-associated FliL family protein n=1 Tax=Paracoccus sp. TaxID=267 RepID=UPI0026E04AFE|nr:flagellar basal body-associated FliL family protein [Paracoccus sp. (in: a-proteobacteria)]MDO5369703.1 flagellar basal body-associated FliL family protein [Paracoccus sp. (in: a-proteobacteria)]
MTDISASPQTPARPLLRRLLPLALPVVALAAGLGTTFTGLWSPLSLLHSPEPAGEAVPSPPAATFLDVPRIVLTIPGERTQTLALSVIIEVEPGALEQARLLMPRILDSYNGFLSQIDASAFSRRGILEIVRGELATRTGFILGEAAVRDLLITEFRIQ